MKRAARGRKTTLETDIQFAICDYLAYRKVFFWRSNNIPAFNRNGDSSIQMRRLPKYTMRGLPDIDVIQHGHFIGLEVKRPAPINRRSRRTFNIARRRQGGSLLWGAID
jgi:hypothetical protein